MKKLILALALNVLGLAPIFSQGQLSGDQKMLPSAGGGTNSSLGNLFSPNLFDGSVNVNIPIYDFSNSYGNFGISLSYNTKGVTVDELSGPLGTHWLLNCQGFITRNLKDIPDETDFTTYGYPSTRRLVGRTVEYGLSSQGNDYWDGQNDDYVISAGNLNFTFKLGKNGYIYTYPESRAKIVKTTSPFGNPGDFNFKVTDIDGTIYEFDVADHADQSFQTGDIAAQHSSVTLTYANKWKLNKITFPNGQQINYYYEEDQYRNDLFLYRPVTILENSNGTTTENTSIPFVTAGDVGAIYYYNLDSIVYPNNVTASFEFDQVDSPGVGQSLSIKQIKIRQNNTCKRYIFNKGYLVDNGSSVAANVPFDNSSNYNVYNGGKLILNSIDIGSCSDANLERYYSFEYYTSPPRLRTSGARDFFGYCNSLDNSNSTVNLYNFYPLHNHMFNLSQSSGQNKNASTNASVVNVLNLAKVKNAYGGSVAFFYETHSGITNVYPNLPTTDPLFLGLNANDGLRIKTITTEDKYYPNNSSIATYTYSGGQYFLNGGYFSYPTKISGGVINQYIMTNGWISPHQLINGSNHGYSYVSIENKDNSGNLLSKTVYHYSNFKDNNILREKLSGTANTKRYFQTPYTDKQYIKDWEIGLPLQVVQIDQNGDTISKTSNHYYSDSVDAGIILAGLNYNINTLRNSPSTTQNTNILQSEIIATDTFLPFAGRSLLDTSVVETFYSDVTILRDTTTYAYDTRGNLYETTTKNSKGEYFFNRNVYNYTVIERGQLGSLPANNPLYTMYNSGIEKLVSTERWKKSTVGFPSYYNDQLYEASINLYGYPNNVLSNQKVYSLRTTAPIGYTAYTGMSMGSPILNPFGCILNAYMGTTPVNFQLTSEVLQTDAINNAKETQIGGIDMYRSMIWDVPTGNKLAEASCKLNEMGFNSFETGTLGNWSYTPLDVTIANPTPIDGNKVLRFSNGESRSMTISNLTPNKEYTMTFWCKGGQPVLQGGGLSSVTYSAEPSAQPPSGSGWVFFKARFIPTNTSAFGIFHTTTAATYYVDDVRIYPTGADLKCYNYTSLFGPSSSIDPAGRITRYEYDSFGRLSITRDQQNNITSKKEYQVAP